MLVLSRKCGESITIGNNAEIVVKILQNQKGQVRIGIDAPMNTSVDRLEIFEKRLKEMLVTEDQKEVIRRRLTSFTKNLKKSHPKNDLLGDAFAASTS